MALSDREQTVLKEMEFALRSASARPSSAPRARERRPHRYIALAMGLLIAGSLAMAIGLRLQNDLGTGVGVLGFGLLVAAGWNIRLTSSLRRWAAARISASQHTRSDA